jgi:biotin carboxyl carrier protein
MTIEIDVNGRRFVVSIERAGAGGRFRLDVGEGTPRPFADGHTSETIDARRTATGWSIAYERDRRVVDAAVTEGTRGEFVIDFPHVRVAATVNRRRPRDGATGDSPAAGEDRILAPMPGRIVRVLVSPGDLVHARQGLVVVEAMKMENELSAARPGRVREVPVTEGMSVEAGRLLVRLGPGDRTAG